jgi:prepilin-type N-terminal cleavage/methylation domain-containing protein
MRMPCSPSSISVFRAGTAGNHRGGGFTLIELLIVIAIILILIAIALPNFLEAQIRAKVTRSRTELRTLSTAIESYQIDFRGYPLSDNEVPTPLHPQGGQDVDGADWYSMMALTTPHQYLTEIPHDIFQDGRKITYQEVPYLPYNYHEQKSLLDPRGAPGVGRIFQAFNIAWIVFGIGPDREWQVKKVRNEQEIIQGIQEAKVGGSAFFYSPTNGTASKGDLILSNTFIR